ncbi:TauD/TfdA family dioxygenase [Variovorax sp. KK3]|uniref:TauD/TfdA dioxygenase family protein n=1 Tax=Variovorax sp. KK3 TaxID=1855728 RepID=UPI00097BC77E|nr:TauD/TfdA family dioxygenase [Variovorax sp. KK3]
MSPTIQTRRPGFVAEVTGIDLARDLDDQAAEAIADAIDHHGVVVVRDQRLSNEEQLAFADRFGPIETSVTRVRADYRQRIGLPQIVDVSNLDENGRPREMADRLRMLLLGNRLWHTDSSFRALNGALSMLLARSIPSEGGETEFSDNRAAFAALPAATRERIDGLRAEHSLMHSRSQLGFSDFSEEERRALPPVEHPLVRRSPDGRPALYIGSHASHVVGWPVPEGRMLLRDLLEHTTQPEFVYAHEWRVGDLVIWDNRCTLHRGRAYDESQPRDLRRVTTSDTTSLSVRDGLVERRETRRAEARSPALAAGI